MKIAILGGGFTGLAAAYDLSKKGYEVTLFEKENVLGGLAVGFKGPKWDWYLERAYHHLLDSEDDILSFAKDIGFEKIFFKETRTASLYEIMRMGGRSGRATDPLRSEASSAQRSEHWREGNRDRPPFSNIFRILPVDSPQDFLRFPLLTLPQKLRTGLVITSLKLSPFLPIYERQTAKQFLTKTMGKDVWDIFWQELFRKKFGKYAENILASFIWARIKKRAKNLGYIEGGFQSLIDYIERKLKKKKVNICKGTTVEHIRKSGGRFILKHQKEEIFDAVISTLPTAIMTKITADLFPAQFLQKFRNLHYLHAVVLILETQNKLLDKTYWLNVCTEKLPFMVVIQHTNFIDKRHYNNHHIAYVGWYVDNDSPLLKMNKEQILKFVKPYIKQIILNSKFLILNSYLFKGPFAQPIFDREFVKNKPDFTTPIKNFFIANLDMTYPYDRGTNYAVKLGREISKFF